MGRKMPARRRCLQTKRQPEPDGNDLREQRSQSISVSAWRKGVSTNNICRLTDSMERMTALVLPSFPSFASVKSICASIVPQSR